MAMDRIATAEAAAIIGCSTSHIRELVRRDKLHPERPSPHVLLFDKAEVAAYATQIFPRGWKRGRPRRPPVAPEEE